MNTVVLKVDGMTCSGCSGAVTDALVAVQGTDNVHVSLQHATATLTYSGTDNNVLIDAISTEAGKNATLLSTTPDNNTAHTMNVVTLSVNGMSCQSCVKKVCGVLEAVDGVTDVVVSLQEATATMNFTGDTQRQHELATIVTEKAKKKAVLITTSSPSTSLDTLSSTSAQSPQATTPRKVVMKVDGMTCMSCVNKIRKALDNVQHTSDVEVSLKTALATLNYTGPDDAVLLNAVVAAGKKAALVDASAPQSRALKLRVEGMTCNSCVSAVRKALESVQSTSEVNVNLKSGLATLTYAGDESILIDAVLNQAGKAATIYTDDSKLIDIDDDDDRNSVEEDFASFTTPHERRVIHVDNDDSTETDEGSVFQNEDEKLHEDVEENGDAVTRFTVVGMTCSSCSGAVEKALKSVDGVNSVSVMVLGGRAKVNHVPSAQVDAMIEAIVNSGYQAQALGTRMPGQQFVSTEQSATEFRIDFEIEAQALNAYASLKELSAIDEVKVIARTVSIRLKVGHLKSSVLHYLESNGGFGRMTVLRSEKAENEALSQGENVGATDVIDEEAYMWKKRFLSAVSFFIIILAVEWAHNRNPSLFSKDALNWFEFLLATPVQFVSGYGFYRASYYSLRKGRATMDVLVSLSTSIAYFSSLIVLVFNLSEDNSHALGHSVLFRVSVMIITMVLLGKWLESSAKRRAAAGVAALSSLKPEYAKLYDIEKDVVCHTVVPVNSLVIGDVVRIIPGDKVPTDGEVIKGVSAVDESMLTGESNPVHKSAGDDVTGGTVNGNGSMVIRTTAVGEAAVLSQIVQLVNDAQEKRAPIEALADRISAVFVPGVVAISTLVFITWYLLARLGYINEQWYEKEGMFFFSLLFALETMVIACPCALGLATPTAVMVASEVATKNGVLFRGGAEAVEAGSKIQAVVFDKTGTLTMGKPTVSECVVGKRCVNEVSYGKAMMAQLMYLIESESHHPLASAIRNYIKSGTELMNGGEEEYYKLTSLPKETPGRGIEAVFNNDEFKVRLGSPIFIYDKVDKYTLFDENELKEIRAMEKEKGLTIVIGVVNDKYGIVYGIEDTIRPEASSVIHEIHEMGIKTALVTGDSSESGRTVGRRLGIAMEDVHIGATPAEKVKKVELYEPSCFVGDGINDAVALTGATIGVAIGAGAPVAAASAPVVLVRADLWGVIDTIDLSKITIRRIRFNFFWAIAYNLVSVPVAAGVLYPFFNVRVPPMVASGAMALSSTCVILSSLALRWYRPKVRAFPRTTQLNGVDTNSPSGVQAEGTYGSNRFSDTTVKRPLLRTASIENV